MVAIGVGGYLNINHDGGGSGIMSKIANIINSVFNVH